MKSVLAAGGALHRERGGAAVELRVGLLQDAEDVQRAEELDARDELHQEMHLGQKHGKETQKYWRTQKIGRAEVRFL